MTAYKIGTELPVQGLNFVPRLALPPTGPTPSWHFVQFLWHWLFESQLPVHLYWRLRVKQFKLWISHHSYKWNNWLFVDLNENLFWDFPQSIFDSRSLGVCLFFRGVVYKIFSGWVVIEVQLYLANKTERIIRIVDSRAFSVLCKPKVPYH